MADRRTLRCLGGWIRKLGLLAAACFAGALSCNFASVATAAQAGRFDYYLLTLSWTPAFCATHRGEHASRQCASKRLGFVVHGLWPQYERGYPESCRIETAYLPEAVIDRVLPIMPSRTLIQHEWAKHGTCSGLDAAGYFGLVERLFSSITLPSRLQAPHRALRLSPKEIRRAFLEANPSLDAQAIVIRCQGELLEEVRICYDKSGVSRACGADVAKSACRRPQLTIEPIP